jgi:hypothetical protein
MVSEGVRQLKSALIQLKLAISLDWYGMTGKFALCLRERENQKNISHLS